MEISISSVGTYPCGGNDTRGNRLVYKEELVSKNLVKDPVVTVEFMNLTVSVLGEVANPGRFNIDKDKLTLWML